MKLKGLPKRAYNILFHTHTVTGIAISFGLFIIFYAGSFSIFRHEIYRWENPKARIEAPKSVNIDKIMETVKTQNPLFAEDGFLTIVMPNKETPFVKIFGAEYKSDTTKATKRFSAQINVNDNYAFTHLKKPITTLGNTIYRLHYFGHVPAGLYISGLIALFFLFASITGVIIHWRNMVNKFYAISFKGKWRQIWTNTHTVLGLIGLPYQIIYAITGALFGLLTLLLIPAAFILFGGDTNKVLATVRPESAILVDENAQKTLHTSLESYYQLAKAVFPDYKIRNIRTNHHGREDGYATFYLDDHKTINGTGQITYSLNSGEILSKTDPKQKSYTESVLNSVTKLHFASFGGIGLKIIYFILGMITCFMILSGVLLWKEARENRKYTNKQKQFHHKVTKIYLAICLGLFPTTAIIFIANKLVPIDLIDRAVYVNTAFFLSWLILIIAGLRWNNLNRLNNNYLFIGGICSLAIPITNGLITGDWLWKTILTEAYYVASVDIFWLITGISALVSYKIIQQNSSRKSIVKQNVKISEPISTHELIG